MFKSWQPASAFMISSQPLLNESSNKGHVAYIIFPYLDMKISNYLCFIIIPYQNLILLLLLTCISNKTVVLSSGEYIYPLFAFRLSS